MNSKAEIVAKVRLTDERRLLLNAVINPDIDLARESWEKLSDQFIDSAAMISWLNSGGERRLMPMLSTRTTALGVDEEVHAACTEALAEAWGLNERIFEKYSPTFKQFQEAGIDMLGLKGIGLIGDVYRQHELRPLGDVDILVRPRDVRSSISILRGAGWRPLEDAWLYTFGSRSGLRGMHAIGFINDQGWSFDLHVKPAHSFPDHRDDEPEVWRTSVRVVPTHPFAGFGLRRPSREQQMIIFAAHIARNDEVRPLHPLLDVGVLLTNEEQLLIDGHIWDRVFASAERVSTLYRLQALLKVFSDMDIIARSPDVDRAYSNLQLKRNEEHFLRFDLRSKDVRESGFQGFRNRFGLRRAVLSFGGGALARVRATLLSMAEWVLIRAHRFNRKYSERLRRRRG